MLDHFPGSYNQTEEEALKLWRECIFLFDTNVLLNTYSYSFAALKQFWQVLESIEKRIWLSYQVAIEVYKNQAKAAANPQNTCEEITTNLTGHLEAFRTTFNKHPSLDLDEIFRTLDQAVKKVLKKVAKAKEGNSHSTQV